MSKITLVRIDESNFIDAFNLKLKNGQEHFVSHPIRSLAQAYVYYHQCCPFGIYLEDTMIGYVMVIYDYDLEVYNIWHMMIDQKYQQKGYGQTAMEECLSYVKSKPFGSSNQVVLTCSKKNFAALHLYRKFGFTETGNPDEDEIELALIMNQ
ncbi:MAG: GNAT family N-acetyltransferase [Oscillospiraceae bacterium]|nr:GNAT family N-acetyltransferase [Oscillospiraceae bacterium]